MFYVDIRNFLKAIRGNGYRPVPKGGTFPIKTIMLVVRSSGLWEAYTQTCPKWDNYLPRHFMPLHHTMPSFMNSRRVLDLLEFKNQASQHFAGNQQCPGVWNSFPFLAWDLSMHPRTHIDFSTNLYALEHAHVVQIWIMHINAFKTNLMHKNVQTNPEKSQKLTQHSCCSTLTRENFWKQQEAMDIVSSPKVGCSLPKPSRLLWEALVCEKHIPKPAPNGTKFVPQHVDAAPW